MLASLPSALRRFPRVISPSFMNLETFNPLLGCETVAESMGLSLGVEQLEKLMPNTNSIVSRVSKRSASFKMAFICVRVKHFLRHTPMQHTLWLLIRICASFATFASMFFTRDSLDDSSASASSISISSVIVVDIGLIAVDAMRC